MTATLRPGDGNLQSIFTVAAGAATRSGNPPEIHARFYPYAGLSSTIRLRRGTIYVRVSDVLQESPPEVLHALACILLAKLYRRKVSPEHADIYRQYTLRPEVLDATDSVRRRRGYKMITTPRGRFYHLDEIFDELNSRYFQGALSRQRLSWSQGKTGRVLGHHDYVHGTIIVSRTLDCPDIPRIVLEYVVYHEMLHVKHPPRLAGGRTIYHGAEFRADEQRFDRVNEAIEWLERIAAPVRRKARRKRSPSPPRQLREQSTRPRR
jgi:hypothetical protein